MSYEELKNVGSAVFILGVVVIAWILLRPVIVGWLRGLLRDLRDEDERGDGTREDGV